jgi:hypothetical protein
VNLTANIFNEALSVGTVSHTQLLYWPEDSASEATGLLAAAEKPFVTKSKWKEILMKQYMLLLAVILGTLGSASAQSAFNCSSFSSTGACGVGGSQNFNPVGPAPSLSGSRILLVPSGTTHQGSAVNYTTKVNVQAFNANFTFVPNGQNVAFVLQNTSDTPGYQGTDFVAGAGCEAGFFQAFGLYPPPNNIFALELDSWSYLGSAQDFTYSSAQIYQAGQSPCNPNDSGPNYVLIDKISTSPVPLNSPASSQGTSTGDTYSANVTYSGTTLTLNMYDVSAGGACPGAKCFTHTWNVDIPSWVGGDTAYVGFTAAPGETSNYPLYIGSASFSGGSATQPTAPASPTQAETPTFSPAAGTYSGAQSVTISDATSNATVYYTTNGTTPTTSANKYTGPITVSSTETLQAMAVATGDTSSTVASAAYTMAPASSDPGNAQVINYSSGFAGHPSQLWMGNGSVYSGSSIGLTNSGGYLANNAWYKTPVNVQAFTTTFTWNAVCPAQPAQCGDGLGFMIISNSNPSSFGYNYSGNSGSQFSWSRCSSGTTDCPSIKSILVKFDLYNNSTGTGGANLTGFYSGGVAPQPPQPEYEMAPSGINMQSGHLMKATLTYNGTVLTETVTDMVTGATYRNSYSANIPALVGGNTALVGFGGSSGAAVVTQNIQSWTYTVESPGN